MSVRLQTEPFLPLRIQLLLPLRIQLLRWAPLASCNISITFKPSATGTRTGSITVNDSASNSPQVINCTGSGQ